MRSRELVSHALARAGVLSTAAASVFLIAGLPPEDGLMRAALLSLLATFTVGMIVPPRWQRAPFHIGLLALDLVALGALGCALVSGSIPGADARIPFICGYLVATLVATVGSRLGTALMAVLGGTMVIGVATALTIKADYTLNPVLMMVQVALVASISFLIVWIAGNVKREGRALEVSRQVDLEIRARESSAAELVSFTQALADSSSLSEIADAVLRHLRCHTSVAARAVALESGGEDVALWEEAGRLGNEHIELRRLRLQTSLSNVGSAALIARMQCHSAGPGTVPMVPHFRTAVDIPVRVGGRAAGVFFLGDEHHGTLPPDRIGILVDVARRTSEAIRRLERQRDHEHRRTALLLRQMREGVLLLGSEGQVLLANPAARGAIEGCAAEDGPGAEPRLGDLSLADLSATPPGVSRRFRATYSEAAREHPTQLACTALCVLDRGRRIGTLVTLSDVTEEELARNRIVQAEKMTLVGQTLAGVAHELNNPLAALIGYADLLRNQELDPAVEKPVQQMREQALRATRIVRNLLNFARRRNPERVPTNIKELVESVVELFAYEARIASVEVQVEFPETPPRVLGDKHALQQVLVNLFQNALHALEHWSGTRVLSIRVIDEGEGIVISVSDTGPGVPEELRTRVFESFFTTKGSNKGTGLGLALSRSITQEHGGDLLLAPDTGGGACFSVRLPRHRPSARAMHAPRSDEDVQYDIPERVLVVDDEVSVRETLVAQLGAMGARVDSAANVIEAQRLLSTNGYEAVIVDIRMPGQSGLDLHKHVLEANPLLAERFVFITGDFVNDDLLCEALGTGRLLLEKPFTMQELVLALGRTVAGRDKDGLDRRRLSA